MVDISIEERMKYITDEQLAEGMKEISDIELAGDKTGVDIMDALLCGGVLESLGVTEGKCRYIDAFKAEFKTRAEKGVQL